MRELLSIIIVLLIVNAFIVIFYRSAQVGKKREQPKTESERNETKWRLLIGARNFAAEVQQNRALRTIPTNIILKPGEAALYSSQFALYETRADRRYQAGHAGVRV